MRRALTWAAATVLVAGVASGAGMMRMVVADLPYARVWEAAARAVEGYPVERAADGVIVTGRIERPPREGEEAFERVAERVTLRVEASGDRITRVTVEVEAEGRREGSWVPISETEATARAILARLRDAIG